MNGLEELISCGADDTFLCRKTLGECTKKRCGLFLLPSLLLTLYLRSEEVGAIFLVSLSGNGNVGRDPTLTHAER
jgi:hypothetical protein